MNDTAKSISRVWRRVVDDASVARLRLVKTGKSYGENVEVLSGLSDGERIVVDGVANVKDGVKVQ